MLPLLCSINSHSKGVRLIQQKFKDILVWLVNPVLHRTSTRVPYECLFWLTAKESGSERISSLHGISRATL